MVADAAVCRQQSDVSRPTPQARITTCFQGVHFDNVDRAKALSRIREFVLGEPATGARSVFFANVHTLHLARLDRQFQECVNGADLVLPDGSGMMLAGLLFGSPIVENLNGTDFVPRLFQDAIRNKWSLFLLGAEQAVVEKCCKTIVDTFPGIHIAGCSQGYISPSEEDEIIKEINRVAPTYLLVAMGSPLQEMWIQRNLHRIHCKVCLGVGGLFDFLSGHARRAPRWMRTLGVEWVFRFFVDPRGKWRRVFLEIPIFLVRLLPDAVRSRHERQQPSLVHGVDPHA